MDQFERSDRKREARQRQRAQRQRKGRLQSRVVAASLICFVLLWGIVFAQMVSGNDPVLGSGFPSRHSQRTAAAGSGAKPAPEEAPLEEAPVEGAASEEEAASAEEEAVPVEEEAAPVEEEFAPEPEPVVTGQS
jgi:hypothetical protein